MINFRLANTNDSAALAQLRYAFRSISDQNIETEASFIERCALWMSDRLSQNNWRCWLAEKDNTIIGVLWLQLIEKIPNPTSEPEFHAYITNVYVAEPSRNRGIGSQLLNEALRFCRKEDVHAVILWPSEKAARFTSVTALLSGQIYLNF